MGLCKCPKKKVTNLFCFVHRVNVCEECMIDKHRRCVVRSYLQWLQDSDYEPVCLLCYQSLKEGDIVRLCCLDLFHVSCLDKHIQSLCTGHDINLLSIKCPSCKDAFFPPNNMISPISNQLRETIKSFWWGREGLGLAPEEYHDNGDNEEIELLVDSTANNMSTQDDGIIHMTSTPLVEKTTKADDVIMSHDNHVRLQLYDNKPPSDNYGGTSNDIVSNQYLHTAAGQQHNRHIGYMAATGLAPPPHGYAPVDKDADDVDMKYTKKSTLQSVGRWYRNHAAWASPSDDSSVAMKRYVVFAFLVFLFFVTLIVLLTRVGQTSIAEEHDHGNWVGGESRHEPLPSDHI